MCVPVCHGALVLMRRLNKYHDCETLSPQKTKLAHDASGNKLCSLVVAAVARVPSMQRHGPKKQRLQDDPFLGPVACRWIVLHRIRQQDEKLVKNKINNDKREARLLGASSRNETSPSDFPLPKQATVLGFRALVSRCLMIHGQGCFRSSSLVRHACSSFFPLFPPAVSTPPMSFAVGSKSHQSRCLNLACVTL